MLARLITPAVKRGIEDLEQARHEACRLAGSMPVTHWRVELDGRDMSGDYLLIEAMNIRCVGPNLCFAVHAQPGDGQVEVVLAGERERAALQAIARDELAENAVLRPHSGRRLRIWCERDDLHVDDIYGRALYEGQELMQIDVELTGRGVDILI